MTRIKRISVAAGLGAAIAFAFASPAAAAPLMDGGKTHDDARPGNLMLVTGQDQYCNAQGFIVIIRNSCNGNGNNDSDGNGDVED